VPFWMWNDRRLHRTQRVWDLRLRFPKDWVPFVISGLFRVS